IRLESIEANEQTNTMRHTLTGTTEQFQRLTAQKQLRAMDFERRASTLAAAREQLDALDIELRYLREALTQAREQRAQKEIEKARLSSDLEHLVQSCHTELGENIVEICERLERNDRSLETSTVSAPSLPLQPRIEKAGISLSDAESAKELAEEQE